MSDPRPWPQIGGYVQTKRHPTRIRCKAYTAPPGGDGGDLITTIDPGTSLGPIEDVQHTSLFVTIMVKGWWINIWHWRNNPHELMTNNIGINYATVYEQADIDEWEQHGWRHAAIGQPEPNSPVDVDARAQLTGQPEPSSPSPPLSPSPEPEPEM